MGPCVFGYRLAFSGELLMSGVGFHFCRSAAAYEGLRSFHVHPEILQPDLFSIAEHSYGRSGGARNGVE